MSRERSDTIKTFYFISIVVLCVIAGALMAHYFGFGKLLGDLILQHFGGGKELMRYLFIFIVGFAIGIFVSKTSGEEVEN